ncbi:CPBP family intramembrane metalloprotease [Ktedonosporobacter rubrisoli]|uniref:CPBP family intramembrane metalloprotease n=1 Tax=Ktedonosporobacter rubrisoli TaxID=2509675 RepID=A0A4V0YZM4_KTERU|nr:CPBP family intramembrane glutamic endopeptidase [Ktedonosporobacter rubrisoli]QBD80231.1 CPBP family intramembrane metalloprotease [Ktedonosporobacter rubrisoli]
MSTKTKGILAFLLLAFGLTWLNWGLGWLLGFSVEDPMFTLICLPALFTPAIATIIVRRWITREGFQDAGLQLNFKRGWFYYPLAGALRLSTYILIVVLAVLFKFLQPSFSLSGMTVIPFFNLHLQVWQAFLLLLLLTPLMMPVFWGEEFGWRGYLQVRLFSNRPILAAITTGLIWGIWHYPLLFHGYAGYTNIVVSLATYTGQTILLSFIYGWLRLRSGSVWPGCLYHATNNLFYGQFFMPLFIGKGKLDPTTWDMLSWIFLGLIALGLIISGQLRAKNPA